MRCATLAMGTWLTLTVVAWGEPTEGKKWFKETRHDFGIVPRGAQLLYRFTWTNPEQTRLEVTEVRSSCGCATVTPVPRVVEPGQTGAIELLVDAKKFVGQKDVTIHLLIGPDRPRAVTLQATAHSRPDIVYNPGQVSFGVVNEGATATQTLDIEYAGTLDWRIQEVLNPSPHLDTSYEEVSRKAGVVFYRLKVGLKASAPAGSFKHEVQLKTNDPGCPVARVLVEATIRPSLTVIPDPLYFGSVRINQVTSRRVTIRGDKPFEIVRVEGMVEGVNVTASPGKAAVHSLVVDWKPAKAGDLQGELAIHTSSEKNSVLRLAIQGQADP